MNKRYSHIIAVAILLLVLLTGCIDTTQYYKDAGYEETHETTQGYIVSMTTKESGGDICNPSYYLLLQDEDGTRTRVEADYDTFSCLAIGDLIKADCKVMVNYDNKKVIDKKIVSTNIEVVKYTDIKRYKE